MITKDNYEAYLVQYAEGMLSELECREVEDFLKEHPDLKEEMSAIMDEDLRVTAPEMEMPNKRRLKHAMVMPVVWRWVAAACVVGIGVMVGIKMFVPQQEEMMIAQMTQPSEPIERVGDTIDEKLNGEEVYANEEVEKLKVTPRKKRKVEHEDWRRIEECDEDTSDVATPIMAEEVEDDFEIASPLPMEEEQLVAMIADEDEPRIIQCDHLIKIVEEPNVVQCDDLIKMVEPTVVESDELIDVEIKPLKLVLEQYITTPLIVHAEKTRGKVVEQLFAMTDEFKNRYISNSNIPQL